GVVFRLWAPAAVDIALDIDGRRVDAPADGQGWREATVATARAGTRYRWIVRGAEGHEIAVPDPASRSNPDGVHAASVVVDPNAFVWLDGDFNAGPWHHVIAYEMHIGAFTPEGTF